MIEDCSFVRLRADRLVLVRVSYSIGDWLFFTDLMYVVPNQPVPRSTHITMIICRFVDHSIQTPPVCRYPSESFPPSYAYYKTPYKTPKPEPKTHTKD